MNYPLISEYIEAIKSAEDNFNDLSYLRPVYDERGNLIMSSGNFAVVFKMTDGEKHFAIKCFLKEQEGREEAYRKITNELEFAESPYLCHMNYYSNELYVDSNQTDKEEFPILLMDWVEGKTLGIYVENLIKEIGVLYDESYVKQELHVLSYNLSRLIIWLLTQPFAHGDLKPDNIIVTENKTLVLIDYDGMYVPSMDRELPREAGSPDYTHPLRNKSIFNAYIDDFSAVLLLLSVESLAYQPSLYPSNGNLLIGEADLRAPFTNESMFTSIIRINAEPVIRLYTTFVQLWSNYDFGGIIPIKQLTINRPQNAAICKSKSNAMSKETTPAYMKYLTEMHSLATSKCYIKDRWVDADGCIYSRDKRILISFPPNSKLTEYVVDENCRIISDGAFGADYSVVGDWDDSPIRNCLKQIVLPEGILAIGNEAFKECHALQYVNMPTTLLKIGEEVFNSQYDGNILFPQSLKSVGECLPYKGKYKNESPYFEYDGNAIIDKFNGILLWVNYELSSYDIPSDIYRIGKRAFANSKVTSLKIPEGIKEIGEYAFEEANKLTKLAPLPQSLSSIEDRAFYGYRELKEVMLPKSLKHIGKEIFAWWRWGLKYPESYAHNYNTKVLIPRECYNKYIKTLKYIPNEYIELYESSDVIGFINDHDVENIFND